MSDQNKQPFFGKTNFIFMIVGIVVIGLGFILMSGGGNELGPDGYAPEFDEGIYSFRRITLAPIIILIGFAIEIYAILKRPKQS